VNEEPDAEDTDEWALTNTYASLVPVKIDLTHHKMREKMQKWDIFTPAHEQIKKI
jgi:5'-nucleotidase